MITWHPTRQGEPGPLSLWRWPCSWSPGRPWPPPRPWARPAPLTRYPYLTDLVGGSVTVNWATTRTSAVTGSVAIGKVGTEPACASRTVAATRTSITVKSVSQYQWQATVPGLERDATYCYRVYLGGSPRTDLLGSDASPTFRGELGERPAEPFSFAVFGDWGQANAGSANPDQEALLARLAKTDARFAVGTGDIANPSGSQSNYGDLYRTGSSVSGVFGPRFWAGPGRSLPLFPGRRQPHAEQHFPAQLAPAAGRGHLRRPRPASTPTAASTAPGPRTTPAPGTPSTPAERASTSSTRHGTPATWARGPSTRTTTTTTGPRPAPSTSGWRPTWPPTPRRRSSSPSSTTRCTPTSSQTSNAFLQGPGSLEGLLSRNGVDIAFNGHAHLYQRNLKPHPGGLVSYVSGGGGASLASIGSAGCSETDAYGIGWKGTTSTGAACGAAHAPASTDQVHHFLLVKVDGTRVTVTPTNAAGDTFDIATYQFDKGGAGIPTPPAGLAATAVSTSQITLSWQPSADDVGVNSYTIYRDGAELATVRGWTTHLRRPWPAGQHPAHLPGGRHRRQRQHLGPSRPRRPPPPIGRGPCCGSSRPRTPMSTPTPRPPPTAPRPGPTPTTAR